MDSRSAGAACSRRAGRSACSAPSRTAVPAWAWSSEPLGRRRRPRHRAARRTCGTPRPTPSCAASSRRRASPGSRSSTPCSARGTATTSRCPPACPPTSSPSSRRRAQAPAWLDRGQARRRLRLLPAARGTYTGLLYGLGSGIMSCAIPDEARAVYHSKGGEDMRDRVAEDRQARLRHRHRERLRARRRDDRHLHQDAPDPQRRPLPDHVVAALAGRRRHPGADQPARPHHHLAQPGDVHPPHARRRGTSHVDARPRPTASSTCGR